MKSTLPVVNDIWSLIKETQRSIRETQRNIKETQRNIKGWSADHEKAKLEMREIRACQKETGEQIKELSVETKKTDKRLKKAEELFTSQWGKLMESLVEGELVKLLNERGIVVVSSSSNMKGEYKGQNWEFDIVAVNGKEVVLVEVKTNLKVKDINYFTKKLNAFTTWKREYKGKTIYGAVAYLRSDEHSVKYAEKQGLFVIRATGNSASIINKQDFEPKAFS
ncbi:MAG: hypothetical protein OXN83_03010 [Oligoflexia bacterium]|nr:hypothetical protein [Oligoflexia bacterium]